MMILTWLWKGSFQRVCAKINNNNNNIYNDKRAGGFENGIWKIVLKVS